MAKLIRDLNLMSLPEKEKLLYQFNETSCDYEKDKRVHQIFEEQVEKAPNKTAVIACDKTLTYKELNEQANRIAHNLIEQGVKVGDIVAFKLPRLSYMISVIFGIQKVGAVYMPIDPNYPEDRIDYMLTDSKTKFCITEDNIQDLLDNRNYENLKTNCSSADNICLIYTSGSTGNPKGVILTHTNVVNHFQKNVFNDLVTDSTVGMSISNAIFDMFLNDVLSTLLFGSTLVLANEEDMTNAVRLAELINKNNVKLIISTPTKFFTFLSELSFCRSIKYVQILVFGGEALTTELYQKIRKYSCAHIINGYGPTETTIVSTYGIVD